ncbi:MAG: hypothetical protein H7318_18310 [Oligoflexus sp.]|nr:hypothetical protein [Oligoflexus sp.]
MKSKLLDLMFCLLALYGCKTTSQSSTKVTDSQLSELKQCIVKTLNDSYALQKLDQASVEAFANDIINHAPRRNDTKKDYVFEDYANKLGCDPTIAGDSGSYGTMIVSEWAVSPLNPDVAKILETMPEK